MGVIDDIKQRLDVVQVVSEYVSLQKSGRNYKALCPFHAEKHASFMVFPAQQSWHCFGACGTGGDIFSFLMRKEGLDFAQALHVLAERAGVALSTPSDRDRQANEAERERLHRINEAASEYFHHALLNTPAGEQARNYVVRRDLSPQTVNNFQLGYAPEGWENLKQYLISQGYKEGELVTAGVLSQRDDGGSYDRFRNRLMFPIRDIQGSLAGFGARALDESLPKYLNSPQTPVFDKSSSLYGIDRAKTAIRLKDSVIITEGYMDVLIAHQYGWENVVASMGTSLTAKQLSILKRLTKNMVLALDADSAGKEAMLRSGETFADAMDKRVVPVPTPAGFTNYESVPDVEIKVMVLPQNKDPDEVIKENPASWQELVEDSKPVVDFILDTIVGGVDLDSARAKSSAVQRLMPVLQGMKDPIQQDHYVQKLARLLKIDDRSVRDALSAFRAAGKTGRRQHLSPQIPTALSSSPLEDYCVALLLQFPQLQEEGAKLLPELFEQTENRELYFAWRQGRDLDCLREKVDASLHEHLDRLMNMAFPPTLKTSETEQHQALYECTIRLQERFLRGLEAKKKELLAAEAETGGVAAELTKLKEQGIKESEQLREIFIRQGQLRQPFTRRNKP